MAQTHITCKKLVFTLTILTIITAVMFFTKQADAATCVATSGDIKIYDENGKSELNTIRFQLFTAGKPDTQQKRFIIRSTGKEPIQVRWGITKTSIKWNRITNTKQSGYSHTEGGTQKYTLRILQDTPRQDKYLKPAENTLLLKNGENTKLTLELTYTGKPTTPETFTLTITFTATNTKR